MPAANTLPVRLRPVVPADIPALYEMQRDPESNRLAAVNPRSLEDFNALWNRILTDPDTRSGTIPRAIIAGDELVGSISVFKMDGLDGVGYWIARKHWGKGIATRALALLLEEVTLRPLHARVAAPNAASIRVLERCGFTITGRRQSPGTERYHACEEVSFLLS